VILAKILFMSMQQVPLKRKLFLLNLPMLALLMSTMLLNNLLHPLHQLVAVPFLKAKEVKKAPICEANLRRSDRLHNQHKGFKSPVCKDKNCIGCTPNPPILSPSVVRDLGTTFCSIDPAKLTDANLNVKSQKGVIDKPKSKKLKLGKGLDVGPARKDKVSSKSTKKPHKDAKDASDP
jgi:hypothetical protein